MLSIYDDRYLEMVAEYGNVQHSPAWLMAFGRGRSYEALVVDVDGPLAVGLHVQRNRLSYEVCTPPGWHGVFGPGGPASWKRLLETLRDEGAVAAYLIVEAPGVLPHVESVLANAVIPPGVGASRVKKNNRRDIRRCLDRGWTVEAVSRPDRDWWDEFSAIHAEVMDRHDADQFLTDEDHASLSRLDWYATEARLNGELGSATVWVRGPGRTIGLYGATAERWRADAPGKMVDAHAFEMERDVGVELGMGTEPGDPLEEYKLRMGAELEPLGLAMVVLDPDEFTELAGERESEWFPPWRDPSREGA